METSFRDVWAQVNMPEKEHQHETVQVRCPYKECNLSIIPLKYSTLLTKLVDIADAPETIYVDPDQSKIMKDEDASSVKKYYRIDNAWDFDNIGVSKATDDIQQPKINIGSATADALNNIQMVRYLVCADCERGPLGFAGIVKQHQEEGLDESNKRVNDANSLVYFLSAESGRYYLKD